MSADRAREIGAKVEARVLAHSTFSREPEWFTLAPIGAVTSLLAKLKMTVGDVGLFEINEAFSAVSMAAMKELSIPREKVNIFGGAVALGHPIGASGARTLVTLLNAMRERNATVGVNAICIGGGEAVAMAVELV
jgi:acetyl-CoA C-acetyltransferase